MHVQLMRENRVVLRVGRCRRGGAPRDFGGGRTEVAVGAHVHVASASKWGQHLFDPPAEGHSLI